MDKFKYAGKHFQPLLFKLNGDFFEITERCASVGIGVYPWSHTKYDYKKFYEAATKAGGSEADLFLCIEDGRVYLPCTNELMLYFDESVSAIISS